MNALKPRTRELPVTGMRRHTALPWCSRAWRQRLGLQAKQQLTHARRVLGAWCAPTRAGVAGGSSRRGRVDQRRHAVPRVHRRLLDQALALRLLRRLRLAVVRGCCRVLLRAARVPCEWATQTRCELMLRPQACSVVTHSRRATPPRAACALRARPPRPWPWPRAPRGASRPIRRACRGPRARRGLPRLVWGTRQATPHLRRPERRHLNTATINTAEAARQLRLGARCARKAA